MRFRSERRAGTLGFRNVPANVPNIPAFGPNVPANVPAHFGSRAGMRRDDPQIGTLGTLDSVIDHFASLSLFSRRRKTAPPQSGRETNVPNVPLGVVPVAL